QGGKGRAVLAGDDDRGRGPARTRPNAARILERGQESIGNKRISSAGQRIPHGRRDRADRGKDARGKSFIGHMGKDSKITPPLRPPRLPRSARRHILQPSRAAPENALSRSTGATRE